MHTLTPDYPAINIRRYRIVRNVVFAWLTIVFIAGFLGPIPSLNILEQSARNLYFHVPMWFTLMAGVLVSAYHSLRYLASGAPVRDLRAREAALVSVLFGLLGLATGIFWARFTWYEGQQIWWNFDPKQSMAAIQLMIYGGYFVLRSSVDDPEKRARMAAVYNLFAFATVPFLLYVLPRQMPSLHPGAEGTPAFSQTDLAPAMRWVFYPAVLGFIGLFWVIYTQRVRAALLARRLEPAPEL